MPVERRQYPRLSMQLPLECYPAEGGREHALRTVTGNISTGGLFFEADVTNGAVVPGEHSCINIELTVPPGEGHSPYEGSVRSVAEVLRCEFVPPAGSENTAKRQRVRIAARFREPLQLNF